MDERRCRAMRRVVVVGAALVVLTGCGPYKWARHVGPAAGVHQLVIVDVAVAPNGDVVAVGDFDNTVNLGSGPRTAVGSKDAFVALYDKDGNPRWDRVFGGPQGETVNGVAVADDGRIVVVGTFSNVVDFGLGPVTATVGSDGFVVALAGDGVTQWVRTIGGTGWDKATAVAADGGRVAVGGTFIGGVTVAGTPLTSAGGSDVVVAEYALATGEPQWAARHGRSANDDAPSIAIDSAARVVVAGTSDAATSEVYAAQFRGSDGAPLWSRFYGAGNGQGVAIAPGDDVVLAGGFTSTIDFGGGTLGPAAAQDIFVARLGSDGATHRWSKRFAEPGPASYVETVTGLAVDTAGAIVLTGSIVDAVDFGGGALAGAGARDPFLVKLAGTTGAHLWSKRFLGLDAQYTFPAGVATGPAREVVAVGSHPKRLQITPGVVHDAGLVSVDGYIAAFGP